MLGEQPNLIYNRSSNQKSARRQRAADPVACRLAERASGGRGSQRRRSRPLRSRELRHRVDGATDARGHALAAAVGMHAEVLEAPVVEDRDHDIAALETTRSSVAVLDAPACARAKRKSAEGTQDAAAHPLRCLALDCGHARIYAKPEYEPLVSPPDRTPRTDEIDVPMCHRAPCGVNRGYQ